MRRFMVHLVTEVEFEDGDEAPDKTVQNYQKHLSETTLLHGDCEAHIFTDAQLFTPHGRRWLARDRAYN
jgi:hypothetical protein